VSGVFALFLARDLQRNKRAKRLTYLANCVYTLKHSVTLNLINSVL